MIEKLKEVEKRYDDISKQLLEPDVYNDQARYTKLMKEHKISRAQLATRIGSTKSAISRL